MTYCVGVLLDDGLVMASDSRTSAGVDNIATFRKMTILEKPDRHLICLLSAGNLSLTQSAVSLIGEWATGKKAELNINKAKTMFRVARIVGQALREVYQDDAESLKAHGGEFNANFILGGQIKGERARLFHVYSAGNFIEATAETPFFQIGETKYGKPVFDRLLKQSMPLAEAAKLVLISFDSTMRSNLSVGLPIDLLCYEGGSLAVEHYRQLDEADGYLAGIRRQWGEGLKRVFTGIAPPDLDG
ncbi:peptidase [Telmatospirillum siberiense]|uniref:Peptidase n=1 Tax=Telmatospirillum siberiense TaxID=382514 RepID=A0A2N3Q1J3_9PROT|nr:peptidase [Telmatospirillum siberiense]PKU26524.1 peptidase [Telmatospirillum siberiense]